jgi:hypothetical protein
MVFRNWLKSLPAPYIAVVCGGVMSLSRWMEE